MTIFTFGGCAVALKAKSWWDGIFPGWLGETETERNQGQFYHKVVLKAVPSFFMEFHTEWRQRNKSCKIASFALGLFVCFQVVKREQKGPTHRAER